MHDKGELLLQVQTLRQVIDGRSRSLCHIDKHSISCELVVGLNSETVLMLRK